MNALINNVIHFLLNVETFVVSFTKESQFSTLLNMETFVVTLDWINVN